MIPDQGDPMEGHPDSWVSLGYGYRYGQGLALLRWQPVLHDLLANDAGYAPGMQLQILPMEFSYQPHKQKLMLSSLSLIDVISLNKQSHLLTPASWSVRLGWDRSTLRQADGQVASDAKLVVGRGFAFGSDLSGGGRLIAGLLLNAAIGGYDLAAESLYARVGPKLLAVATIGNQLRVLWQSEIFEKWYEHGAQIGYQFGLSSAYSLTKDTSLRLAFKQEGLAQGRARTEARQWEFTFLYFF